MEEEMFAIVPSISFSRGDQRRNVQPYFTTLGISYGDLHIANMAMRTLNGRGIVCHMEVIA